MPASNVCLKSGSIRSRLKYGCSPSGGAKPDTGDWKFRQFQLPSSSQLSEWTKVLKTAVPTTKWIDLNAADTEKDFKVAAPTLDAVSILIDASGVHVIVGLGQIGEEAPVAKEAVQTRQYEAFKEAFTKVLSEQFGLVDSDLNLTRVRFARGVITRWLSDRLKPVSAAERIESSRQENLKALADLDGPDLGLFIPAKELDERITQQSAI